jgi:hypothetical protein
MGCHLAVKIEELPPHTLTWMNVVEVNGRRSKTQEFNT